MNEKIYPGQVVPLGLGACAGKERGLVVLQLLGAYLPSVSKASSKASGT